MKTQSPELSSTIGFIQKNDNPHYRYPEFPSAYHQTAQMHLIVYVSDYRGQPEDLDRGLANICRTAKQINPERMITGVLFQHNGMFLQAIEGPKENLEALMSSIQRDTRHRGITRIVDTEISERSFPDWNMDSFNLDKNFALSKETIVRYERAFSRQCKLDLRLFIELLKDMHSNEDLKEVILAG